MMDFDQILSRVTIRDILDEVGIKSRRYRIACPIHEGSNPTAFKFNDSAFICFSCGAKGGLLQLAQYLFECDRNGALKCLCQLAGIPYEEPDSENRRSRFRLSRPDRALRYGAEYNKAQEHLEWVELERVALETALRILKSNVKLGRVSLSVFYDREQILQYQLEESDQEIAGKKYEINRIKKEATPNDKSTTKSN